MNKPVGDVASKEDGGGGEEECCPGEAVSAGPEESESGEDQQDQFGVVEVMVDGEEGQGCDCGQSKDGSLGGDAGAGSAG